VAAKHCFNEGVIQSFSQTICELIRRLCNGGGPYANIFACVMSQFSQYQYASFLELDLINASFIMKRMFYAMKHAGYFNGTQTSYMSKDKGKFDPYKNV